nr:hypothetical protein [Nocardioides houyundeii]
MGERWTIVTSAPFSNSSWAMSWPLLQLPTTTARRPAKSTPRGKSLEWQASPENSSAPGSSGRLGSVPLTPVASTTCRGRTVRWEPSARFTVTVHSPDSSWRALSTSSVPVQTLSSMVLA